jgi:SAM-dependent methyltransferase
LNDYSGAWFRFFLDTIPPERTAREVAFIARRIPLEEHARVLDVCCGPGRHALPLARLGYDVTGVDRDPDAIAAATHSAGADSAQDAPRARFRVLDVLDLGRLDRNFDAVLCLWASFGYSDATANRRLLAAMAARLRKGGRLILDIYNRDFFATRTGERRSERAGQPVVERSRLDGDRLTVELTFGDPPRTDAFGWQTFTPDEALGLAEDSGLRRIGACAGFDEATPPSPGNPRMQLTLERPS